MPISLASCPACRGMVGWPHWHGIIYLRDHNTSQSAIDVFNTLYGNLGRETFCRLFPVILTDNGSEFSNPNAIEYDTSGLPRTKLFYCDPSSPQQKPEIELNHEFIPMVLPKGKSFDNLTQADVNLLSCHINSVVRKKLNVRSSTAVFSFFYGDLVLHKLGLQANPHVPGALNESTHLGHKKPLKPAWLFYGVSSFLLAVPFSLLVWCPCSGEGTWS